MKKYLPILPDCILIAGFTIFFLLNLILGSFHISQLFILIPPVLLLIQLRFKVKWLGIFIGSILALIGFYMTLAVASEYREFPTVTFEAIQLLLVGLVLFGSILVLSLWVTIRNILP